MQWQLIIIIKGKWNQHINIKKVCLKVSCFFLCSIAFIEAQESLREEKREGGCGWQKVKYVFLTRLNRLISFNHSSGDLSFHIWNLNSEMCNYAFSALQTKAEMTGLTTFRHGEAPGGFRKFFFSLARNVRSVVCCRRSRAWGYCRH